MLNDALGDMLNDLCVDDTNEDEMLLELEEDDVEQWLIIRKLLSHSNKATDDATEPETIKREVDESLSVLGPREGISRSLKLVFGGAELMGKRSSMEDRMMMLPDLGKACGDKDRKRCREQTAFFSVYDGHSGVSIAEALAQTLHRNIYMHHMFAEDPVLACSEGCVQTDRVLVAKAVESGMNSGSTGNMIMIRSFPKDAQLLQDEDDTQDETVSAPPATKSLAEMTMKKPSARPMGRRSPNAPPIAEFVDGDRSSPCSSDTPTSAKGIAASVRASQRGSTVRASIVDALAASEANMTQVILCCNVGDSRAVLSRAGNAIALSQDHKATREDERARIEAAGGYVHCTELIALLGMHRARHALP